jgi:AcrR family transcriptional regulator
MRTGNQKLATMPKVRTHRQTSEQPLELKEACVFAAREFIAEHGVERLSLRDVARRLGVSHQAPYRHYPSRDHLLAEVIRRCFASFANYLDAREAFDDARLDLESLGKQYLTYAASHPLEYRLMFSTPWPDALTELGLEQDATHAFDVLRRVLRRIHGADAAARTRVDLDAMFIWSNMHGLAAISQSNVMKHLSLARGVSKRVSEHTMHMMSLAMDASQHE